MEFKTIRHIDSTFRNNGDTSSFNYTLELDRSYEEVAVLLCNIPMSFYMVPANYNTFILIENGVNITITIPVGTYNVNSFIRVLEPLLNAATTLGLVYSITVPSSLTTSTALMTYSYVGAGTVSFKFTPNIYLNEQFGFNYDSTNTFVNNSLTSTNVVKFISEDTLYICSDMIQAEGESVSILQTIYNNNSSQFANIVYQATESDMISKKLVRNKNNVFNFQLLDSHLNPIDLNGLNMLITLVFFTRDRTMNRVEQLLKEQNKELKYITDYIKYLLEHEK